MVAGTGTLECLYLTYAIRANLQVADDFYPTACFDSAIPALRLFTTQPSERVVYDNFITFQGHYLARHIQILSAGKLAAEMNVNIVELLNVDPDALLTAPSTALPVDLTQIKLKGMKGMLLKKAAPIYPDDARSKRVDGIVNVAVTVKPNGHLGVDLQVLDGPGPRCARQLSTHSVNGCIGRLRPPGNCAICTDGTAHHFQTGLKWIEEQPQVLRLRYAPLRMTAIVGGTRAGPISSAHSLSTLVPP